MILDTYCGQGGAAVGLKRVFPLARIVGVDIIKQPRYPFEFYEADALWFIDHYGAQFDLIWASPPCQSYSTAGRGWGYYSSVPALVPDTREALQNTKRPYIIENVVGAPLMQPIMLCGTMFDLKVFRHRLFETNFPVPEPKHPRHDGRVGLDKNDYITAVDGGCAPPYSRVRWQNALGIDWMNKTGMVEAVPPAYSEYIGRYVPCN